MTNAHVVEGRPSESRSPTSAIKPNSSEPMSDRCGAGQDEATALPVWRIGDVSRLRVGEWVVAMGSPFGLKTPSLRAS